MSRPFSSPATLSRRAALALMAAGAAAVALPAQARGLAADRAALLARGFNLPDWADRADGIAPSRDVLERLRELGFTSIRLPLEAVRLDREGLKSVRAATALLTGLGYAVTLDLHDVGLSFEEGPNDASDAAAAAWATLAGVAADFAPDQVFCELLNEPPMDARPWLGLRDRLAETVRATCPAHTIIWGAARYQGIWETLDIAPLADANAIVAVHYYTPLGFTHQCENWYESPLQRIAGLPFPATRKSAEVAALRQSFKAAGDAAGVTMLDEEFAGPWTVARIEQDFADLGAWSKRHQCPAILNEFGVLNFCVDAASRQRWSRAVRQAAERHGIGWTWWEVDQGFGFIASREGTDGFDTGMIDALTGAGA